MRAARSRTTLVGDRCWASRSAARWRSSSAPLLARSRLAERLLSPVPRRCPGDADPRARAAASPCGSAPGCASKLLICALIVFFPIAIATMVGLRSVDPRPARDGALLPRDRPRRSSRRVEIPAALPVDPRRPAGRRHARRRRRDRGRVGRRRSRPGRPDQPRPRQPVRHPAHVRRAPHDRPARHRAVSRRGRSSSAAWSASAERRHPPRRTPVPCTSSPPRPRASPSPRCSSCVAACSARLGPSPSAGAPRPPPRRPTGPVPSTARPCRSPSASGYIPSVQFAQFYLAEQSGLLRRRRARRDAPEQDRPRPRHARSARARSTSASATARASSRPSARASPSSTSRRSTASSRTSSFATATCGIKTAADLKGKKIGIPGKYGSSWIMLQALLRVGRPHPRRRRDRRVPGLRPGGGAPAGRGRRRDRLREQRADPAPDARDRAGRAARRRCRRRSRARASDRRGDDRGQARRAGSASSRRRSRRWTQIAADPQKGLDATFAAVPDLAADPTLQRQILDATIATWTSPRTEDYGTIDEAGWQASLEFMTARPRARTPSPSTSWSTTRCCRNGRPSVTASRCPGPVAQR